MALTIIKCTEVFFPTAVLIFTSVLNTAEQINKKNMLYFAVLSSAMVTTAETLKYCSGDYQLANKKQKKNPWFALVSWPGFSLVK